ncbi:MAG: glycosyltransferase family 39 protein [Sumerlaeia bacterium]
MKKLKTAAALAKEKLPYPQRDVWVLLAICLVVRLVMTPMNVGEYTDGVLQVTQLTEPTGIWPPLYSAVVYPFKFLFGYLWTGRLISAIASAAALYPLYRMARRAFGTRAALYTGVFYIVAPVAMRWGVRMMTDAMFSLWFWWAVERLCFASDEREEFSARRALTGASLFATLACLTRWQGLMLLPPLLVCYGILVRRFRVFIWKPLAPALGLAILPLWIWLNGFIHGDQFTERLGAAPAVGWWEVILAMAEPFIYYLPYFLTIPVFIWALTGMYWVRMRRGPFFGWMMLYTGVVLLIAQSAFSSFQERYFLPLHGFFWVLAGAGMYAVGERWRRARYIVRRRLFPYLAIGTFTFSAAFGLFVLIGQREAWGDLARASRLAGDLVREERAGEADGPMIFTNEVYRLEPHPIVTSKVDFFARENARLLDDPYVRFSDDGRPLPPSKALPPGSLVVLSNLYNAPAYVDYLSRFYTLEPVAEFQASLLPVFPDNMSVPGTDQSPAWFLYRYRWQRFSTIVLRVEGPR